MRKRFVRPVNETEPIRSGQWLDLTQLATVEVTSEDSSYPVESALMPESTPGWRASEPGVQTIRLLFDEPQSISSIHLEFHEDGLSRTQEFVVCWRTDGDSYQELVRQQYNFSPGGPTDEREDYSAFLYNVAALELSIVPNIGGGPARASLKRLLLR